MYLYYPSTNTHETPQLLWHILISNKPICVTFSLNVSHRTGGSRSSRPAVQNGGLVSRGQWHHRVLLRGDSAECHRTARQLGSWLNTNLGGRFWTEPIFDVVAYFFHIELGWNHQLVVFFLFSVLWWKLPISCMFFVYFSTNFPY